ncbi:predicted protein [Uncinocarpus reesii 1704]|uniref:SP-RING-type domain-containing protein n=1 Tax=Uncinocarpus reesii (strain UAMH 1704) TaxID=336963 RepID=C4JJD4_UNCRE|nr:uncharacterized protein UREG_01741 [Uncinocarpus reesii 1704]EEP76892.1 predicted protein [Uncinocarpus reesii 1704]
MVDAESLAIVLGFQSEQKAGLVAIKDSLFPANRYSTNFLRSCCEFPAGLPGINSQDRALYDARLASTLAGNPVPPEQAWQENTFIIKEYISASSLLVSPIRTDVASSQPAQIVPASPASSVVGLQNTASPIQRQFTPTSHLSPQFIPPPQASQYPASLELLARQARQAQPLPMNYGQNTIRPQYSPNNTFQQFPGLVPQHVCQALPHITTQHVNPSQYRSQYPVNGEPQPSHGAGTQLHPHYQSPVTSHHGHPGGRQNTPTAIPQRIARTTSRPPLQSLPYASALIPSHFVVPSNSRVARPANIPIPAQTHHQQQIALSSPSFSPGRRGSDTLLLPHSGAIIPELARPNPILVGLHQMPLRVGVRELIDDSNDPSKRLLIYPHSFAVSPFYLGKQQINFSCSLTISPDEFKIFPAELPAEHGYPIQGHTSGTRTYQLKCVKLNSAMEDLSDAKWTTMDCSWPDAIYIHVNDTEHFVCRKFHNGRDLPLHITSSLRQGDNKITLTCLRKADERNQEFYAVAIETLESMDCATVRKSIKSLSKTTSIDRIIKTIENPVGVDDEIAILGDYIAINLIDPFMARIFDIPTRGKFCSHWECFDLDTFLSTRMTVISNGHGMVENWKCPICRKDARPSSLVIDEFLLDIRAQLARQNKLNEVRAILVLKDGSWIPKIEQAATTNQQGKVLQAEEIRKCEVQSPKVPQTSTKGVAQEVIEID